MSNANALLPPHSLEAEQAVIASLMISPDALEKAIELLRTDEWYFGTHARIFNLIIKLYNSQVNVDILSVSDAVSQQDEAFRNSIDLAELATMVKNLPSAANVDTYINIIKERALLRKVGQLGVDMTQSAFARDGVNSESILNMAESKILDISQSFLSEQDTYHDTKTGLGLTLDKLNEILLNGDDITGLATGFDKLDEMTLGLQKGELAILAARPSMGKSALALNICQHALRHVTKPILFMSLEMPEFTLYQRILASENKINLTNIRKAKMEDSEYAQLSMTMKFLTEKNLFYVDESNPLTPMQLRSRARRLAKEQGGLSLIVIDYLQLMHSPAYKDNRNLEIADISRALKALAKELDIPILALSQLSRSVESRTNKRPMNADLRDSGSLEQDADVIMFIYRDDVYNEFSEEKGTAEVIIGKNRNGEIGTVKLMFNGQYSSFDNITTNSVSDSLKGFQG